MNQDEFENLLTCKICLDTLLIPVRIKFSCFTTFDSDIHRQKCDYVLCLQCARTYLQMNIPKSKRKEKIYCINCRKTYLVPYILNASKAYEKDMFLMRLLDTLNKTWSCRNVGCTYETKSQFEMDRHLRDSCTQSVIKCKWNGCKYYTYRNRMEEHEQNCICSTPHNDDNRKTFKFMYSFIYNG
jgi:hypothetical protein